MVLFVRMDTGLGAETSSSWDRLVFSTQHNITCHAHAQWHALHFVLLWDYLVWYSSSYKITICNCIVCKFQYQLCSFMRAVRRTQKIKASRHRVFQSLIKKLCNHHLQVCLLPFSSESCLSIPCPKAQRFKFYTVFCMDVKQTELKTAKEIIWT
jgi:hypothetical protein